MGAWPGARPARQRPRCNLLGALRFARCCGREWRGRAGGGAGAPPRDRPLRKAGGPPGPAATAARFRRAPRRGQRKASRLRAVLLGFLPSPTPTHRVQRERRAGGGQREATPPAGGSVRAPGGRDRRAEGGGRAQRGPAEAAACVVLFLDSFQLLGKKTFVSRYKKRGGWGERSWKKSSKAQTRTLVCKVD